MNMVKLWSKFPRDFVKSPSREAFRAQLNMTLIPLFQLDVLGEGCWTR